MVCPNWDKEYLNKGLKFFISLKRLPSNELTKGCLGAGGLGKGLAFINFSLPGKQPLCHEKQIFFHKKN